MINKLRAILVIGLLIALAIVSAPALALGLGQLKVLSQPGQPLVAEIPIVTSDPSELDNLQARLASPDTFRRVGLQPPQGIVSDLQFRVALDARGNPVIRVSSPAPVQEAQLTFLLEVDWGQGRLVREYSALVDAPRTVAAPSQPPIQAPIAPRGNTISRPAVSATEPVASTEPVPDSELTSTEPAAATQSESEAAESQPEPDAIVVAPPPLPSPAPRPAQAVTGNSTSGDYGPVQAGETLGRIAEGMRPDGYTLDQTMLALLRANPEAFINDNVNLVKQGAVLRMPGDDALAQYSASQARAVVREQISQWRQLSNPAPLPEAVAGQVESTNDSSRASPSAAPRVADARLEITPPSPGSGQQAGTRSGIAAGGEGQMLRQDMQQTQETLAARTAEVDELKTRVAELEKLQQQQQQLISLKDTELAAAQQRLTVSNQQPVPALSSTEASADAGASGTWIWLVLGLALIGAAIVGWLLMRRQAQVRPAPSFRTSALAQGMPGSSSASALAASHGDAFQRADVGTPAEDSQTDPVASGDRADDTDVEAEATVTGREPSDPAVWNPPAAGSVEIATPTWHAGDRVAKPAADPARPQHEANSTGSASTGADSDRIELARAYLDLGDADTARTLLQEVVEDGDVMAGDEARRMLRDLG